MRKEISSKTLNFLNKAGILKNIFLPCIAYNEERKSLKKMTKGA